MLPAFAFGIALYGVGDRPSGALAMWRDLNAVRRVARLPELALEPRLCDIARDHALDMAARNYFSHESPEGKGLVDRLDRADWQYGYAAENIALDIDERSAQRALYASTHHRESMLGRHYQRVGIAAIATPQGEIFVEDFSD